MKKTSASPAVFFWALLGPVLTGCAHQQASLPTGPAAEAVAEAETERVREAAGDVRDDGPRPVQQQTEAPRQEKERQTPGISAAPSDGARQSAKLEDAAEDIDDASSSVPEKLGIPEQTPQEPIPAAPPATRHETTGDASRGDNQGGRARQKLGEAPVSVPPAEDEQDLAGQDDENSGIGRPASEDAKQNLKMWMSAQEIVQKDRFSKADQNEFAEKFGRDTLQSLLNFISGIDKSELDSKIQQRVQQSEDELKALIPCSFEAETARLQGS